jgi:hypothetical protein
MYIDTVCKYEWLDLNSGKVRFFLQNVQIVQWARVWLILALFM